MLCAVPNRSPPAVELFPEVFAVRVKGREGEREAVEGDFCIKESRISISGETICCDDAVAADNR